MRGMVEGKVVIVTGAGAGNGREIALAMAASCPHCSDSATERAPAPRARRAGTGKVFEGVGRRVERRPRITS